jgi:hypothetical protein
MTSTMALALAGLNCHLTFETFKGDAENFDVIPSYHLCRAHVQKLAHCLLRRTAGVLVHTEPQDTFQSSITKRQPAEF